MAAIKWDLEYALYFGVPSNKIELSGGRSRWAFPFMNREEAEAHFSHWLQTLQRWKGTEALPVRKGNRRWRTNVGGISMKLYPRPVEFRIPMVWEPFEAFLDSFWHPQMWPGEWPSWHRGFFAVLDHQDVQMNLWSLFGGLCDRHGGVHSSRVDITLTEVSAVSPDEYYFSKNRDACMIDGDYFCGVPDLIAEVYSPASLALDRGPRQEVYRRAGVPHLWLLHPVAETIETLALRNGSYQLIATHRPGDTFGIDLFPGEKIQVDALFKTQSKRRGDWPKKDEPMPEPIPEWILPAEKRVGLEYFFLLGHPEHRWEIWGNRAPSVLAFGSAAEAKARLAYFIEEACRWEGASRTEATLLAPDVEQAEVGRFRLTRTSRWVHLDIALDARKYRELLQVWVKREAWDWGE